MESKAADLNSQAGELEANGNSEGAAGLREEASALTQGAAVLRGDEHKAHNKDLPDTTPMNVDPETGDVNVDMDHYVWREGF